MRKKILKVTILFEMLPHYRKKFYELLHESLNSEGIELQLLHGERVGKSKLRNDEVDIPWAQKISQWYLSIGGISFQWQFFVIKASGSNLIVAENAYRILSNLLLIFYCKIFRIKLAWWGMGRNMQISDASLRNRLKKVLIACANYHFAYTEGAAAYIRSRGVDQNKVSVIYNTIDVKEISESIGQTSSECVELVKKSLGIGDGPIGIFCGGLYKGKGIPFLLDAVVQIQSQVNDFEFIIIGDGEEKESVEAVCQRVNWLHYVGQQMGKERTPYFLLAKVFLLPVHVGLNVVDSFAYGTPTFATTFEACPEIEYLKNGYNGIIEEYDVYKYSNTVVRYLRNEKEIEKMRKNCLKTAQQFGLDTMVENFKNGIIDAISR